ncbi:MAG TPA: ATP-binding protein [Planktothrix sp.]
MQKRWRILAADDDPAILNMLKAIFEAEHFQVILAKNGIAALEGWDEHGGPMVVLLDWNLGDMQGLQVCEAIRRAPQGNLAYVIFLTARGLRNEITAGINAGADDYVVKPFNAEELKARVRAGVRLLDLQMQLIERNTLLEELVYSVTHDLRTPLIAMDLTANQALDGGYGALPDSYRPILTKTRRSVGDLLYMVDTLLRVARYEAVEEHVEVLSRTDIVEIGTECVSELEPIYKRKSLTLHVDATEPHIWVRVERQDMKRIMQNLLDNAIKFTPAQGQIKLSIERVHDNVIVLVQDTGEGVKQDEAKKLFDRFARAKDVGHTMGSGLGLYLCRKIIESHGGVIDCIPRPEGGTTFGFMLPVVD